MRKNAAFKQSLTESVVHPYQGLVINFGFLDVFLMIKMEKLYHPVASGINGKSVWILICDALTKMIHGDCRTSKASPNKY